MVWVLKSDINDIVRIIEYFFHADHKITNSLMHGSMQHTHKLCEIYVYISFICTRSEEAYTTHVAFLKHTTCTV